MTDKDKPLNEITGKPRIVVLGGGFGGLSFCQAFKGDAEVVLIDRQNHHLFQPLLYQVAMAGLSVPDIAEPLRSIFRKRKNIETLMAQVESIDLNEKLVHTPEVAVRYTYLVLAMGGRVSYFGNDQWARHAPGLKSVEDAMRIRRRILTSFERAETISDEAERKRLMTIVVVGGGPTGVELAGAMGELARKIFRYDFRRIDPRNTRIILVNGDERLLKPYPEKLSASAKDQLESLGVEMRIGVRVKGVDKDGVDLSTGERIEARNVLWGGGIDAVPVTKTLGVDLGHGRRIKVNYDLSIPDHPKAFAIGDIAQATQPNGDPVPGLAPAAMQMGKHTAKLITQELKHGNKPPDQREAFEYWDKGKMATIGRKRAVADIGPFEFSGLFAWLTWLVVHLTFLIGFRNRIAVLFQWFNAYISFRAGARIIYNPTGADPKPGTPDAAEGEGPPEDAADAADAVSGDDEKEGAPASAQAS